MVLTTRGSLSLGAKVAAKLPPTQCLPQPGGTEINTYMPNRHQQTLLQPATAAVCLTATSSLIQGWGTRVLHLRAAPPYLSNSEVGPMMPGDTRAGPAVTLWSRASTGLQDCYLRTSKTTISSWTVGFPRSITITQVLPCPKPAPPEHPSLSLIFPDPRPPALSAATAAAPVA